MDHNKVVDVVKEIAIALFQLQQCLFRPLALHETPEGAHLDFRLDDGREIAHRSPADALTLAGGLLAVLAAALLPLVFDEEDLKGAISAEVHRQTGRELSIEGALDFSVFPWLALEVGDLSLSNAEGFGEQPLAEIGQGRVGVRGCSPKRSEERLSRNAETDH